MKDELHCLSGYGEHFLLFIQEKQTVLSFYLWKAQTWLISTVEDKHYNCLPVEGE